MCTADSLEKTLMLGKTVEIEGRRRRGNRGWDGWMASPTQWTWVWADSGRWWRTGRPAVLQSMGSQRVRHNLVTEQQEQCTHYYAVKKSGFLWHTQESFLQYLGTWYQQKHCQVELKEIKTGGSEGRLLHFHNSTIRKGVDRATQLANMCYHSRKGKNDF